MSRRHTADVAVYAPLAGTFYASRGRPSGGAELQSLYLVKALAEAGLNVRHVVAGVDRPTVRDGIGVVPLPAGYASRGVRRRLAVLRALREADASVYIQRNAGFETGVVGTFARATARRFVYSSSSLADFDLTKRTAQQAGASLDEWPTRLQYRVGLRAAHRVVVQTEEQEALARRLRLDPVAIRSFCEPASFSDRRREALLWVGRLIGFKDPLAYVELARAVPEAVFWMVATDSGPQWTALADRVRAAAAEVPNLELVPPRGREELFDLYERAVAVVTTSHFEGFPNALLEAWARGTPALSLRIDPDGVIERRGLGFVAHGSAERLAAAARQWWRNPAAAAGPQSAAREYVVEMHAPAVVGAQWVELVRGQLGG